MKQYLCYDVKGIQQFIFSVPKLKYIVGASAIVHEYDTAWAADGDRPAGTRRLFSGGGRGAFLCDDDHAAEKLRTTLVSRAAEVGLDLRISGGTDLSDARLRGDPLLYPFCPESLEGEPCAVSGLWPVERTESAAESPDVGIHPVVLKRREAAERDKLGAELLEELAKHPGAPKELLAKPLGFLKQPSADPDDDEFHLAEGRAGQAALGNRNRWAVVAMDGNDIGRQYRAFVAAAPSPDRYEAWLTQMSGSLERATRGALLDALAGLLARWWADNAADANRFVNARSGRIILPFRPLVVGGDDLLCLCHCRYAADFASSVAASFTRRSREASERAAKEGLELWPATEYLTISAGIAYTSVSYPLAASIPFAESLMADAKSAFRRPGNEPTPSALDWEHLTENLIDTPRARRNRSLCFRDEDLDEDVSLTRRPYTFEDLGQLQELAGRLSAIPRSVRSDILPNLRQPWTRRVHWLAALGRREANRVLADALNEFDPQSPGNGWTRGDGARSTGVPDALSFLEEEHRMDQNTAN